MNPFSWLLRKPAPKDDKGRVEAPVLDAGVLANLYSRGRTVQTSWTDSNTALGKHRAARLKRNRTSRASRAANIGRHPQSARVW